jgi:hypothetical protein
VRFWIRRELGGQVEQKEGPGPVHVRHVVSQFMQELLPLRPKEVELQAEVQLLVEDWKK